MSSRALPMARPIAFLLAILVMSAFSAASSGHDKGDDEISDDSSDRDPPESERPSDGSSDEDDKEDEDDEEDGGFLSKGHRNETNKTKHECVHGNWSYKLKRCLCDRHWRLEPFWNTMGLLKGQCTQFSCQSDEQCQTALGIKEARCPLPGWNCNCGLAKAAYGNKRAQCMWKYFVIGIGSEHEFLWFMSYLWRVLLGLVLVSLLFGANYAGAADAYSCRILKDDLAWCWFSIKFAIWFEVFVVLTYAFFLFVWSLPVVFQLFLTAAILICCCLVAFCNIEHILDGEAFECFLSSAGEGGLLECACLQATTLPAETSFDPIMFYFLDASIPGDYECGCFSCFRRNFRCLFWNFPRIPENMLGGIIGLIIGTHPIVSASRKPLCQCCVRLLSLPCVTFVNRSEQWRRLVNRWLQDDTDSAMTRYGGASAADLPHDENAVNCTGKVGEVLVEYQEGDFGKKDGIFNLEDYEGNACWICASNRGQWDKWEYCGHVFCAKCSTEMMKRRMPCPLCRVRSAKVVRRKNPYGSSNNNNNNNTKAADERQRLLDTGKM